MPENDLDQEKFRELLENPRSLPTFNDYVVAFPEGENLNWLEYNDLFHKTIGYEILTKEYVDGLTEYLSSRISELFKSTGKKVVILEVGGGNGRLSYFINKHLAGLDPETYQVVCSDITKPEPDNELFPIDPVGFDEAVKKHSPSIVISSWMPAGADWTPKFRDNNSVQEYLLIGPGGNRTGSQSAYSETGEFKKKEICTDLPQLSLEDYPTDLAKDISKKKSKTFSFSK